MGWLRKICVCLDETTSICCNQLSSKPAKGAVRTLVVISRRILWPHDQRSHFSLARTYTFKGDTLCLARRPSLVSDGANLASIWFLHGVSLAAVVEPGVCTVPIWRSRAA